MRPFVVAGGSGDDVLIGSAGIDTLFGVLGNDHLEGRDGRDVLTGGVGADVLLGEVGDDDLFGSSDGDVATCERPHVRRIRRVLAASGVRRGRKVVRVRRGGSLGLSIVCDQGLQFACDGRAAVRVGGRRVARARFRCGDFFNGCRYEAVDLRLPVNVRRRVRRERWVGAVVVVRFGRHGLPVTERVWLRCVS